MNEKKATPINEAAPEQSHPESTAGTRRKLGNTSAAAQRARVLDAVRSGPKSTLQLRRDCDVLSPAARVLELKRRGFDIFTNWTREPTDCGTLHRVAQYVLLHGSGGQA